MPSPMRSLPVLTLLAASLSLHCATDRTLEYPPAPRGDVVDTLHGVGVPDPYRWMEEMDAPEVLAWARAQDDLARGYVAGAPRDALRARIAEAAHVARYSPPVTRGDRHFFLRFPATGPGRGTTLLLREGDETPAREIVGPSDLPEDGRLVRAVPDPAGRRVAYVTAPGGSNWGAIRIHDVAAGADLPDVLTGVHAALSTVVWATDGSALFYERFDVPEAGAERTAPITGERVALHRIGDAQDRDAVLFVRPDLDGWSLAHSVTADGRYLVIVATDGATQHARVFYRSLVARASSTIELVATPDAAFRFVGSRGDTFWFWTDLDAPRGRIVAVDLGAPERTDWRELVPEADEAISSWMAQRPSEGAS